MQTGAITSYMDVAQVSLYVFWVFFFGLVIYLRKEDKREGYPMVTERPGQLAVGWPTPPKPKTFLLPHGGVSYAPRQFAADQPEINGVDADPWFGSAVLPVGNPLTAGVGPNAYALRADVPDRLTIANETRILPMRLMPGYVVDEDGPNPIGMTVVGDDGVPAGQVVDIWLDSAEDLIRYLEVTLTGGGNILVPMPLIRVIGDTVNLASVLGAQIADAPRIASPDQVTMREEDKIQSYFASGHLFAKPSRQEPLL